MKIEINLPKTGPIPKGMSVNSVPSPPASKVIIHKLLGEVSLVKLDTIENVSAAFLKCIFFLNTNLKFFHLHYMQLFSMEATIFLKKL